MQPCCGHIAKLAGVLPFPNREAEPVCFECAKTKDKWVNLRICQDCGLTLCCDSSPNQHARKHFAETGHTLILSAEPSDDWLYCYDDNVFCSLKAQSPQLSKFPA